MSTLRTELQSSAVVLPKTPDDILRAARMRDFPAVGYATLKEPDISNARRYVSEADDLIPAVPEKHPSCPDSDLSRVCAEIFEKYNERPLQVTPKLGGVRLHLPGDYWWTLCLDRVKVSQQPTDSIWKIQVHRQVELVGERKVSAGTECEKYVDTNPGVVRAITELATSVFTEQKVRQTAVEKILGSCRIVDAETAQRQLDSGLVNQVRELRNNEGVEFLHTDSWIRSELLKVYSHPGSDIVDSVMILVDESSKRPAFSTGFIDRTLMIVIGRVTSEETPSPKNYLLAVSEMNFGGNGFKIRRMLNTAANREALQKLHGELMPRASDGKFRYNGSK